MSTLDRFRLNAAELIHEYTHDSKGPSCTLQDMSPVSRSKATMLLACRCKHLTFAEQPSCEYVIRRGSRSYVQLRCVKHLACSAVFCSTCNDRLHAGLNSSLCIARLHLQPHRSRRQQPCLVCAKAGVNMVTFETFSLHTGGLHELTYIVVR